MNLNENKLTFKRSVDVYSKKESKFSVDSPWNAKGRVRISCPTFRAVLHAAVNRAA